MPGFFPTFARFERLFGFECEIETEEFMVRSLGEGIWRLAYLRGSRLAILVNSDHHRWRIEIVAEWDHY